MSIEFDYEALAAELLVALRGRRSQTAWSRRLGYRSNIAYRWESGRRQPTISEVLRACARTGIDTRAALERFCGRTPPWLVDADPADPAVAAALLRDLQGNTSVSELSRRMGAGRSTVSRWLSGHCEPRLPDFLKLVEVSSLRCADLLVCLVPVEKLPSLGPLWQRLEARRRGAQQHPWTQAILRALDIADYHALPAHQPGWIAARLGIAVEEEARCLQFLQDTGQIRWTGTHFMHRSLAVDTRRYPEIGRRLKAHWYQEGARRAEAGKAGQFSYNVFSVSRADFERIREEHLRYFHALRAIVAQSQPEEVVAVAGVMLFPLEEGY